MRSRPDLNSYDFILVAFSGGKDSAAVLLDLLEAGVDPRRIELHHHLVDGDGPSFMDWPCTAAYCQAVASAFGIPLFMSYREGGFLREMHRRQAPTAAVVFEDADGGVRRAGGCSKKLGTRLRFPQRTADLSRRYCSSALKIDVMDAVIRNQERFLGCRTLVCTGERAEESPSRSAYAAFEPHRSDTRDGARRRRLVDHYRPVHGWAEQEVWAAMRRHRLVPHVAYQLGWSRVSCMTCVFLSADGWATVRTVFPERFHIIAEREAAFGCTIHRTLTVSDLADRGTPYPAAIDSPELVSQARDAQWRLPILATHGSWCLPPGAFGRGGGPP